MAFDARLAMLKQYFGYDRFLGGQEQAVDTLLAGRDLLAVMPTGAGKSICFQLPALCLPGTTLVVSPLISLMADQVMALRQAGVSAAYLNRSLTERQYALALQYARMGRYKLIYVAPSGCRRPAFSALPGRRTSRCWLWTRPTASASGGRTSAPAIWRSPPF